MVTRPTVTQTGSSGIRHAVCTQKTSSKTTQDGHQPGGVHAGLQNHDIKLFITIIEANECTLPSNESENKPEINFVGDLL